MEIEFKFTRPSRDDYNGSKGASEQCVDAYTEILKDYFKKVFDRKDIEITAYNLNHIDYNTSKFLKVNERLSIKKAESTEEFSFKSSAMSQVFPYNINYLVQGLTTDKRSVFSFYIYGQNNCCGMMSTSGTLVNYNYQNRKLGRILQYFKEDLAIANDVACLVCTDKYHDTVDNTITQEEVNVLKPYLANTRLLLSSGWDISKLSYNRKSNNVIALFTKNILREIKELNVIMKIKIVEEKLVKIVNVSVGCDPELFLKDTKTNKFIPSFYVMKGDKHSPVPITEEGHNIQCDNVMVEYGVPPTKMSEGADKFVEHNLLVQDYLRDKVAKPNGLELVIFPSAVFEDDTISSDKAKEFGCDPDYNVWKGGKPNTVGSPKDGLRTCGGHLHLGYDNYNTITSNYIVKALDLFLSVPLVIMEPNNRRKEMYGKAGAYRQQPWGVEYRSTSNYIFSSPELMKWAFNQVKKAIEFVNNDELRFNLDYSYAIAKAIDNKDIDACKSLISKYNLEVLETVNV